MKILRKLLIAGFAAALFAAPLAVGVHQADARAGWTSGGGFSSMGSMGGRTYNFNGGWAINRSMTPATPELFRRRWLRLWWLRRLWLRRLSPYSAAWQAASSAAGWAA